MKSVSSRMPLQTTRHWSLRCGFTLPEILVVVLIIALSSSVALPRYTDYIHGHCATAAAHRIASELNMARHDARTRSINRKVQFNIRQNRYEMVGMKAPDDPSAHYRVQLDEGICPVTLITVAFVGDGNNEQRTVEFDMYGRPTVQRRPLISGTVIVESGSHQAVVTIDPVTGEAKVS